jgi:DNA adenine methylase
MGAIETDVALAPTVAPTRPALRYHGGKFRLAAWIQSFFPAHTAYVEPFGGAAGVLLQKPRSYAEVYNDLDGEIVNFFRVLQDPAARQRLINLCALTPYSRDEFELSWQPAIDAVERARRVAIRAQMGFGSAGATKGCTGFRVDTKRSYGTSQHLWAEYPAGIEMVGARFTGVLIENRPAIDVMLQHDAVDTLTYLDPPYVFETRCMTSGRAYYRHELSDQDHAELLDACLSLQGMAVISGYPSALYEDVLGAAGWISETTSARISAGRGSTIRTECAWLNPACQASLANKATQQRMFE